MKNVRYTDPEHTMISADFGGMSHSGLRLDADGELHNAVKAWVAAGGVVAPYEAPPEPPAVDPRDKLAAFLARNPDVVAMIEVAAPRPADQ